MEKPTEPMLSTDGSMDYDLAERVVRQLQSSRLTVYSIHVMTSLPEALRTGRPEDEHSGILVSMALITDGHRGWLALVDEVPEYDAAFEMTDFFDQVMEGDRATHVIVRAATMRALDPCLGARTLDLRTPEQVRAEVERAYEEAFAPRPDALDPEELLERLRRHRYTVQDERELRTYLAENE